MKRCRILIVLSLLAVLVIGAGNVVLGEWWDHCPGAPICATPYPVQPTYTPRLLPTCLPTPTCPPNPSPTPYPTATEYPPQPTFPPGEPTDTPVPGPTGTPEATATPTTPATTPTPSLQSDGYLTGWMLVYTSGEVTGAGATGAIFVHPWYGAWGTQADAENYLSMAADNGLLVVMDIEVCASAGNPAVCIVALSEYDNLIAWFTPDEISWTGGDAGYYYDLVKDNDPGQRPVWVNPGTSYQSGIDQAAPFADVVWYAGYPEFDGTARAGVLQGLVMSQRVCVDYDCVAGSIVGVFDPGNWGSGASPPTPDELRCDVWQAVIGGAHGVWYYAWRESDNLPALRQEVTDISEVLYGSLDLSDVIVSPDVPQTITSEVLSGPTQSPWIRGERFGSIQTLQKVFDGDLYLFAVNIGAAEVSVRFGGLPNGSVVTVLTESRTVDAADGTFGDVFASDAVHLYRVRGGGKGLGHEVF